MLLTYSECFECGKETAHHNGKCSVCSGKEAAREEERWKALSLEDKVEILRKQIDDLRFQLTPIC